MICCKNNTTQQQQQQKNANETEPNDLVEMSSLIVYDTLTVFEWCAPVFQHVHCTMFIHMRVRIRSPTPTPNTEPAERQNRQNYVLCCMPKCWRNVKSRERDRERLREQKLPKTIIYTNAYTCMIVNYVGIVCIMYKHSIVCNVLKCFCVR